MNKKLEKIMLLPKDAYLSESWFKQEQALIFEKNWQFAGFIEDLKENFLTVQVGRCNLIILKNAQQQLRAYHNLCRHRGTQLLRTCGKKKKTITCPYHDWSYSLEGELIAVPQEKIEFPELDKSRLGLHKAAVKEWLGMIWVHVDPNAPFFFDWLGEAQKAVGPHRVDELVEYPDTATQHDIKANWKIIVENYIDGYHLSHLHSNTLDMYNHQQQHSQFVGSHFAFYEPLSDKFKHNLKKMSPFPLIEHFTDEQPIGAYVPMFFPNLGIAATESSWSIFHVIPLTPEVTRVITRTRLMPVSDWEFAKQASRSWAYYSSQRSKYDQPLQEDDPMESGDFMLEDVFACEQQQKALQSPLFSIGATARYQEAAIQEFQQHILNFMEIKP